MIAPDRSYAQYRSKPKTKAWCEITPTLASAIYEASEKVRTLYDIDSNEGAQLDIVGRVVVTDRSAFIDISLPVYECNVVQAVTENDYVSDGYVSDGYITSSTISSGEYECGDDEIQCSNVSVGVSVDLSDDYFRTVLKAKIFKNNSESTIDDILSAYDDVISGEGALRLVDGQDMSYSVEFYGDLTPIEQTLLTEKNLMPKPQGARFKGFLHGIGHIQCNFDGDYECGDESAESVGFLER